MMTPRESSLKPDFRQAWSNVSHEAAYFPSCSRMPAHVFENCHIIVVEGAGRGVAASLTLSAGAELLACSEIAAHVIFREYRKEVCSNCFLYDRGTTLPVRANELGKVFCSKQCQQAWVDETEELGIEAWRRLTAFINKHSKHISMPLQAEVNEAKPTVSQVDEVWRQSVPSKSGHVKSIDPDVLGFLLSAILTRHTKHKIWSDAMSLTLDVTPYKTSYELQVHCQSFTQLHALVPDELKSSCTQEVCRRVVEAGSHNAFGIRSGGEDAEEYMGYAVYPQASYYNHSCAPNLGKKRIGKTWYFFCERTVAPGEQLCISYLGGDEKGLNLVERRERLQSVWDFVCQCQRCVEEQPVGQKGSAS